MSKLCDTEDWSNDTENSALHLRNKLDFLNIFGYTLFWLSTLDILLTISNFEITCQLILICNYVSTNSQSRLLQ